MDYSKLVPSRELCEELQTLGICQDGAELWWLQQYTINDDGTWDIREDFKLVRSVSNIKDGLLKHFVAPMLSRMMEDLLTKDESCFVGHAKDGFFVEKMNKKELLIDWVISDINLPKAIAKALIAIKKVEV